MKKFSSTFNSRIASTELKTPWLFKECSYIVKINSVCKHKRKIRQTESNKLQIKLGRKEEADRLMYSLRI